MNYLNVDQEKTKTTVKELNKLLADYHMYYQKLRNFHWNIVGPSFFALHTKFEEMYDDARVKIDEIAERILTLRYQPISNLSDYIAISDIKEASSELSDVDMVKTLLHDHHLLVKQLTVVIAAAEAANDEGTIDFTGAYIGELEKVSWMLDAFNKNTNDTHQSL